MKKMFFCFVAMLFVVASCHADIVNIDVGRDELSTSPNFNNVTELTVAGVVQLDGTIAPPVIGNNVGLPIDVIPLVDDAGATTTYSLQVNLENIPNEQIAISQSGADYIGPYPPEVASQPQSALISGLFLRDEVADGQTEFVRFVFSGLSSGETYSLLAYGARGNNGNDTDIFVTDANGTTQQTYNPFNNDSVVASFTNLTADANGEIELAVSALGNNQSGTVNFIQLESTPATGGGFVPPATYSVFRGIELNGAVADFAQSDDVFASYNPGFTISNLEAPVWLIFDAVAASATEFVVESQAGTPGLTYTVEAFDWTTQTYTEIGEESETFGTDSVVSFAIAPANFDIGGEVRGRVGWRRTGFTINFPWEARVDQVGWNE